MMSDNSRIQLLLGLILIVLLNACKDSTTTKAYILSKQDEALIKTYNELEENITISSKSQLSFLSIILDDCPWLIPNLDSVKRKELYKYNRAFTITGSSNPDLTECILRSKYFDKVDYNQDSCFHYAEQAYQKAISYNQDSILIYLTANQLIRAAEYQRNALLALGVENDFLNLLDKQENIFFQHIYQRRIISLIKLGKLDEAKEQFDAIWSSFDNQVNHRSTKLLESALFNAVFVQHDKTKTEKLIEQVLTYLDTYDPIDINFFRVIGQYYYRNQDIDKALEFLNRAREFENNKLNYNNAQTETIHFLLSQVYESRAQFTEAKEMYLSNCAETVKAFIKNPTPTNQLNINDLISIQRIADITASSGHINNNIKELKEAKTLYSASLQMMNQTLDRYDEETLLRYFYYQTEIVNELINLNIELFELTKEASIKYEIADLVLSKNNLRFKYEQQIAHQLSQTDPSLLSAIRNNELDLKEVSIGNLLESKNLYTLTSEQLKLKSTLPRIASLDPNALNHTNRFKKTIGSRNDQWLIFSIIDDQLLQLVWLDQDLDIYINSFSAKEQNQLDSLIKMQSNAHLNQPTAYQSLAYAFYKKLIPGSLTGQSELNLILDGTLNYLSFDALVTNENMVASFSELEYLITQTKTNRQFTEDSFQKVIEKETITYAFSFSSVKTEFTPKTRLTELSAGIAEAKMISELSNDNKHYQAQHCTKENFIEALKQPDVNIHLATHGYANAQERDQLKLYFRNKDLSLDSLFAYELLESPIQSQQVVLSACETAYGKTESVEGVYNWPRYLLQQGAQSVISTLWLLNDVSGSEIFKYYYTQEQDLHHAKLNYLEEGRYPAQPYYWAGLVEY